MIFNWCQTTLQKSNWLLYAHHGFWKQDYGNRAARRVLYPTNSHWRLFCAYSKRHWGSP